MRRPAAHNGNVAPLAHLAESADLPYVCGPIGENRTIRNVRSSQQIIRPARLPRWRSSGFRKPCRSRFEADLPGIQPHPKNPRTCFEGPFGEVIRATGPMAKANPFRFSTKYQDDETDLLYYGYRYSTASAGRWLSRDPIEELGGLNLYAFVRNAPVTAVDPLGESLRGDIGDGAKVFCDELWDLLTHDPHDGHKLTLAEWFATMAEYGSMCGTVNIPHGVPRCGGGKNLPKISKYCLEHGKEDIDRLRSVRDRLRSLPNKTPEIKKEMERVERDLRKAIDRVRKCEEHSRQPKH
jgi:RHS repeat-associated protein